MVSASQPANLSENAIKGYLAEYEQCMESYRHTYQTIWQAGAIFAAASAAIVAFAADSIGGQGSNVTASKILMLAPVPFLFWWWGIFIPMDRYGEERRARLAALEGILSAPNGIHGLEMNHFRVVGEGQAESSWVRLAKFKWIWRPRVKEVVFVFASALLAVELWQLWEMF